MGLLDGHVAVVTGGARGIGRAIALGLAREGAKVAIGDLDLAPARATAAQAAKVGPAGHAAALDVTSPESCKAFCAEISDRLGPISVVVNNAGVLLVGRLATPELAKVWEPTMRVNVDGPLNVVNAALPDLRKTRGRVVNICSTSAFVASIGGTAYATSKGAVLQLTKVMAVELGSEGIRVNAIAPGSVETNIHEGKPPNPERLAKYLQRTPLGRIGQPEDIVGPVIFLASEMSSYVTGTIIPVDGGFIAAGIL